MTEPVVKSILNILDDIRRTAPLERNADNYFPQYNFRNIYSNDVERWLDDLLDVATEAEKLIRGLRGGKVYAKEINGYLITNDKNYTIFLDKVFVDGNQSILESYKRSNFKVKAVYTESYE